jgi:hypothetical protein
MRVAQSPTVNRLSTLLAMLLLTAGACGSSAPSDAGDTPSTQPAAASTAQDPGPERAPGTVVHGDASTNLDTAPISAADYAMYNAIMGGASALLSTLTPEDRKALEFAKQVDAGAATVSAQTQSLLAQARALQHKDEELARLQGVDARYLQVKAKIDAVIGARAQPASSDDAVAKENRRYLEAHRQTIERFQNILRDPLSRPPAVKLDID